MAVMKSEQILTESSKSFEDAMQTAVSRFSKTVRHLRSANVNNLSAVIEGGEIVSYRVNMQITFEVEDQGGKGKKKKKK
ncbi:MAG TPA: dodecin family protein [Hyphomonadaceae bacterium]|nr:dodecin family protein [Hyphomonadaceae bacterium]